MFDYNELEPKHLLAGISLRTIDGFQTLNIAGTTGDDVASIQADGSLIHASLNSTNQTFNRSDIQRIRFTGDAGNDSFTNQSNISAYAHGGDGNDTIRSGFGDDTVYGGDGNDSLTGQNGNDFYRWWARR